MLAKVFVSVNSLSELTGAFLDGYRTLTITTRNTLIVATETSARQQHQLERELVSPTASVAQGLR
jgi:hypothetical protein